MTPTAPSTCPDDSVFFELIEGRLDDDARDALHVHLDTCAACSAFFIELGHVIDTRSAMAEQGSLPPDSQAPQTDPPAPLDLRLEVAPEQVGRYQIGRRVGAGAMGIVFEAEDTMLGRRVAVKLLRLARLENTQRPVATARMLREARLLAAVDHPNVLPIHDVGTFGEHVYLAVRFVDGATLRERVRELGDDRVAALRLYIAAGEGLAAAHRAGLVHRDVKPSNVLVDRDDHVFITDFGLARSTQQGEEAAPDEDAHAPDDVMLTRTGAVLGTPRFMSPEAHAGREIDARSDQFSFCVALHEALLKVWPFEGDSLQALRHATQDGALQPPPRGHSLPDALIAALHRGLSVDPSARFPGMSDLLDALRATIPDDASPATLVTASPGNTRVAWGAGLVALVATASLVGWWASSSPEEPGPPTPRPAATTDVASAKTDVTPTDVASAQADAATQNDAASSAQLPAIDDATLATLPERTRQHLVCKRGDAAACAAWATLALEESRDDPLSSLKEEAIPRLRAEYEGLAAVIDEACEARLSPAACTMSAFAPPILAGSVDGLPTRNTHATNWVNRMEDACRLGESLGCQGVIDALEGRELQRLGIKADTPRMLAAVREGCAVGDGALCERVARQLISSYDWSLISPADFQAFSRAACAQDQPQSCLVGGLLAMDTEAPRCVTALERLRDESEVKGYISRTFEADSLEALCTSAKPQAADAIAHEMLARACHGQRDEKFQPLACDLNLDTLTRLRDATDADALCQDGDHDACERLSSVLLAALVDPGDDSIAHGANLDIFRARRPPIAAAIDATCDTQEKTPSTCALAAFSVALEREDTTSPEAAAVAPFLSKMERACSQGQPIGCMVIQSHYGEGLLDMDMYGEHRVPQDEARRDRIIEAACRETRGAICVMIAGKIYESILLDDKAELVVKWLDAACTQGDPRGCLLAHAFLGADAASCPQWFEQQRSALGADTPMFSESNGVDTFCDEVDERYDPERAQGFLVKVGSLRSR